MYRKHTTSTQKRGEFNISSEQWQPNWAPELNEKHWKLDTNRQLEVFTSKLESGSKYFIKQDTTSYSSLTTSPTTPFTTIHEAESEMTVSGIPQGGQEIDITYTRTRKSGWVWYF